MSDLSEDTDSDTNHYLVVAKVEEKLSVGKNKQCKRVIWRDFTQETK
jgi:hypothetical protein